MKQYLPLGLVIFASILKHKYRMTTKLHDMPLGELCKNGLDALFTEIKNMKELTFIGFSTMCDTFPRSVYLAKCIKESFPNIPIVMGGPQVSFTSQDILKRYSFIDVLVLGEVETVVDELMDFCENGQCVSKPGIVFQNAANNHEMNRLAPLTDLNEPIEIDYDIYYNEKLFHNFPIEIGRGCPYNCTFCCSKNLFQRRFRWKHSDMVVKEIHNAIRKYHPHKFIFVHDHFTADRKRVIELCGKIKNMCNDIIWRCSTRADSVDEKLLRVMYNAGCREIFFGLETGSDRMQKIINKNFDLEKAKSIIQLAIDMGFILTVSMIIGFPEETQDDLIDTLTWYFDISRFEQGIQFSQIHLLAPLCGTDLMNKYSKELLFDGFYCDHNHMESLSDWEREEIRSSPPLYSSFYFIPNQQIDRSIYRKLYWILAVGKAFDQFFRSLISMKGSRVLSCMLIDWLQSCDLKFDTIKFWNHSTSLDKATEIFEIFLRDSDINEIAHDIQKKYNKHI
jgi:radical SAM superfamily enzyme YgiQ (UPF0313 family)